MSNIKLFVVENGSFDITASQLAIKGAYPSLDGTPLHPISVSANPSEITYNLANGKLKLAFRNTKSGIGVTAVLSGFEKAPRSVQIIGNGVVSGAEQIFQQGGRFGGPTKFVKLPEVKETLESWIVSGIVSSSGAFMTISANDHRRFMQRSIVYPEHSKMENPAIMLDSGFATESIPLSGKDLALPELIIRFDKSVQEGLSACAAAIAKEMKARAPQPPTYHWCSWYYLYHNLTEEILGEYLKQFSKMRETARLETVQIDAGYFPAAGDWLEVTSFWPSGLESAFKNIRKAGFRAGIWIGPYMVGNRSNLYKAHPDWVLHGHDGKPIAPWKTYNEPKPWGYRDEETYVLDISHPDALRYITSVFRTFRKWGAEFFKTDFMLWGLQDSADVVRHSPGKTSVEYFRDFLEIIRKEIGEESYWLACIAPFAPFIGYADGMRIAGDVGASWKGGFGPQNMIQESQGDQYFNNVWWHNDPDAILLRNFHIHLNDNEIKSLALWQGMLGGVTCTSDPFHEMENERVELWKFLEPGKKAQSATLPFYGKNRKLLVAVRRYEKEKAWALLAFNPSDESVTERLNLKDAIGSDVAFAHLWGIDFSNPLGKQESLVPELEPHDSVLYYLSEKDCAPDPRFTLGGAKRAYLGIQ